MVDKKLTRRELGLASAGAIAGATMLGRGLVHAQEATPVPAGGPPMVLPPGVSVYADGLFNPRYITFDENDTMYVAEAGDGGTDAHYAPAGDGTPADSEVLSYSGLTGQVTKITSAGDRTVLTGGLPSYTFGTEVVGPAGIAYANGTIYLGIGGPGPATALIEPIEYRDSVVSIDPGTGEVKLLANIGEYERSTNPDPNAVDSNLYGTTVGEDGMVYQADAGGNTVYKIDPTTGEFSVFAVIPGVPMPGFQNTARGGNEEIDPVPTGLAPAPGGGVYFGELTGGPFPPGAAGVYRIDPDGTITTVATGLTMVTGVEVSGDGSLYAVQISENFLAQPPAAGSVVKIDSTGAVTKVIGDLPIPNDIAFDSAGNMYVVVITTSSAGTPPSGMVLKVDMSAVTPDGTPADGGATPDASPAVAAGLAVETIDLAFKPNQLEATAGEVTVEVTNAGVLPHDFTIDALNVSSGTLASGESKSITFTAAAGDYQFYCSQPGHKDAGMVGKLTVS